MPVRRRCGVTGNNTCVLHQRHTSSGVMGNASTKRGGGSSTTSENGGLERQGSAALGPFSVDEFSLLEELFL